MISAPSIQGEINDQGVIENLKPDEVDSLIKRLKASIEKDAR